MPKGPDYTEKDLCFWGGLIGGLICVHLLMQQYGSPPFNHPIVTLIMGGVVGMGLGTLLERAFVNWQAKNRRAREERKQDDLYGNTDNRHQW